MKFIKRLILINQVKLTKEIVKLRRENRKMGRYIDELEANFDFVFKENEALKKKLRRKNNKTYYKLQQENERLKQIIKEVEEEIKNLGGWDGTTFVSTERVFPESYKKLIRILNNIKI